MNNPRLRLCNWEGTIYHKKVSDEMTQWNFPASADPTRQRFLSCSMNGSDGFQSETARCFSTKIIQFPRKLLRQSHKNIPIPIPLYWLVDSYPRSTRRYSPLQELINYHLSTTSPYFWRFSTPYVYCFICWPNPIRCHGSVCSVLPPSRYPLWSAWLLRAWHTWRVERKTSSSRKCGWGLINDWSKLNHWS